MSMSMSLVSWAASLWPCSSLSCTLQANRGGACPACGRFTKQVRILLFGERVERVEEDIASRRIIAQIGDRSEGIGCQLHVPVDHAFYIWVPPEPLPRALTLEDVGLSVPFTESPLSASIAGFGSSLQWLPFGHRLLPTESQWMLPRDCADWLATRGPSLEIMPMGKPMLCRNCGHIIGNHRPTGLVVTGCIECACTWVWDVERGTRPVVPTEDVSTRAGPAQRPSDPMPEFTRKIDMED